MFSYILHIYKQLIVKFTKRQVQKIFKPLCDASKKLRKSVRVFHNIF